jgi:ATP-dependent Clp protease protease subunit
MALVPSVTELLVAEMLYLQYDDPKKPIYLYINSAGVVGGKAGSRLGYETEALSIYDTMMHVKPPVRTLCVGTAYGEAALLLAAGEKGTRAALPSASVMLRQPMQRYAQMQASDVDIYRKEMRKTKNELVREREKGGRGGERREG